MKRKPEDDDRVSRSGGLPAKSRRLVRSRLDRDAGPPHVSPHTGPEPDPTLPQHNEAPEPERADGQESGPSGAADPGLKDDAERIDWAAAGAQWGDVSAEWANITGADLGDLAAKAALARRVDSVVTPCQELLEEALAEVDSRAGAVYSVDGPGQVSVVASAGIAEATDLPELERVALRGVEANRPLIANRAEGGSAPDTQKVVAVPCTIQGDISAVLVLMTDADHASPVVQRLESGGLVRAVALAADRARIHFTLERRMVEADAVKRQLEAYAVDLRSVFLSERARSEELGSALVELEETYEATVRGLAIAVEAKDEYTGGHLFRVSRYGMTVTAIVAPAHRDDPQFEYGFLLHDVGKLAVPDAVLIKDGALTDDEWEQIRAHPASGRTILERIPFLKGASEIVYCHHERWDGKGFPQGLAGEEIPLGARIFPIADAFDAMTTSRPYREAMPLDAARAELVRGAGTQFWPDAVDAFMAIPSEVLEEIRRGTLGASGW